MPEDPRPNPFKHMGEWYWRDEKGQTGPYEASLVGTPVGVPDQPVEILRTIHSFDPCLACAVHVVDANGEEKVQVEVR